jgi:hypothetical protein
VEYTKCNRYGKMDDSVNKGKYGTDLTKTLFSKKSK